MMKSFKILLLVVAVALGFAMKAFSWEGSSSNSTIKSKQYRDIGKKSPNYRNRSYFTNNSKAKSDAEQSMRSNSTSAKNSQEYLADEDAGLDSKN